MAERTCIGCGAEFSLEQSNQRYCTKACKKANAAKAAQPKPAYRECLDCTRLFPVRRWDQKCCNAQCTKHYINNVRRRKHHCTCDVCGSEFVATKPSRLCSAKCLGVEHAWRIAGRDPDPDLAIPIRVRRARKTLERAAGGTSGRSTWVSVLCRSCGKSVVRRPTGGKWATACCSVTCYRRLAKRRREHMERNSFVENVSLTYLCERDNWTCQICGRVVKRDAVVPHPLAPTHDHIIPVSCGGQNSNANAQLAHFLCNAKKGAGAANDQLRLIG